MSDFDPKEFEAKIAADIEASMSPHDDSGYKGHCPLCSKQLVVSKYKTVDCPEGHYSAAIQSFEEIWNAFDESPLVKNNIFTDNDVAKFLKDLEAINIIEVDNDGEDVEKTA